MKFFRSECWPSKCIWTVFVQSCVILFIASLDSMHSSIIVMQGLPVTVLWIFEFESLTKICWNLKTCFWLQVWSQIFTVFSHRCAATRRLQSFQWGKSSRGDMVSTIAVGPRSGCHPHESAQVLPYCSEFTALNFGRQPIKLKGSSKADLQSLASRGASNPQHPLTKDKTFSLFVLT